MITYIIFGVITGSILGVCAGLYVTAFAGLEGIKKRITIILISIATGALCSFIYYVNDIANEYVWNNGVCMECDGKLEFINASHTKYNNRYYYKCDNCDNVIELDHLYK